MGTPLVWSLHLALAKFGHPNQGQMSGQGSPRRGEQQSRHTSRGRTCRLFPCESL